MADSYPNVLDVPSCKPLAYLPVFGSLAQFGHSSIDDRPNYELSEFRGMRLVSPKSKRHVRYVDLSILLSIVVGVDRYEVGGFGKLIHDHPNQVILVGRQWQTHDEVHANVIPLPLRNAWRLQQSSKLHIIGLDLLVSITLRHIPSCLMLKVHLGTLVGFGV
jgi:hypothetical protein